MTQFYSQIDQSTRRAAALGTLTKSRPASPRESRYKLQDAAASILQTHRVRGCGKHKIKVTDRRGVVYNPDRKKAHFSNVQICGLVWVCPVCAAKITEGRRLELQTALKTWRDDRHGHVFLMTLTNPHTRTDSLFDLKNAQRKATHRFFSSRKGVSLMKQLGRVHHVKNYEVTYGSNGWHPHHHILLMCDVFTPLDSPIILELKKHWRTCCVKAGLKAPSLEHGLDFSDGTYADRYVSKWGLEHELTKSHVKKGIKESLTPWDFLRIHSGQLEHDMTPFRAAALFKHYAESFKGARQLVWSRGAKADLLPELEDLTDAELAEVTDDNSIEVMTLDDFAFSLIVRHGKRHQFLTAVEADLLEYDAPSIGVIAFIDDLIALESALSPPRQLRH